MTITENLFLTISKYLGVRVTPDNFRSKIKDVASVGGITGKIKTDILIELLFAIADLEKKIDDK